MKVLLLNGSAKRNGCTNEALSEIASVLESEGISAEIFHIGTDAICDCTGCGACAHLGKCIYGDDGVNEFTARAADADGFVFGTPVYYAHPSGRILSFLDRAFYSSRKVFAHKPGAAIASARRAGTTASVDVLNKYFTIAEMPVVSSSYWNMVHGLSLIHISKYFAWFIIRSKYIIIRHLIEVADMISTLLHTTANGGRGKAVPPKRFCGCRRRIVGIVFKRHGTVTFMWRAINGF